MIKLVIVESRGKAIRLAQLLGPDYVVEACRGYVREMPRDSLGVDIKATFRPEYQVVPGKEEVVERLRRLGADASAVYVATECDRTGEMMGWHVLEILELRKEQRIYRVHLCAMTAAGVTAAFESPKLMDMRVVEAEQTRWTMDRLVSYLISPLACEVLDGAYWAGRLPGVVLRLLVNREREIFAFRSRPGMAVSLRVRADGDGEVFNLQLASVHGQAVERLSGEEAEQIRRGLRNAFVRVEAVERSSRQRRPYAPFTTSTLLQASARYLGFPVERTMELAQQLYEAGLITAPRTDRTVVSAQAELQARNFIGRAYGPTFVPGKPQRHGVGGTSSLPVVMEAVRPCDVAQTPESLGDDDEALVLYRLIWERFVASEMSDTHETQTWVRAAAGNGRSGELYPAEFRAQGCDCTFEGWRRVYAYGPDEAEVAPVQMNLPRLAQGQVLGLVGVDVKEVAARCPDRYTESALVAELERTGLGRAATFVSIIRPLKKDGLVVLDGGVLRPTRQGAQLVDFLVGLFGNVFDTVRASRMEAALDALGRGEADRLYVLQSFWGDLEPILARAAEDIVLPALELRRLAASGAYEAHATGDVCPQCGAALVKKVGIMGLEFVGCSNYPSCVFTRGSTVSPLVIVPGTVAQPIAQ